MTGRYLLDTNVAIAILEKELDLEQHRGSGVEIFLNTIVAGELFFDSVEGLTIEGW